jgi:hypothetical protein
MARATARAHPAPRNRPCPYISGVRATARAHPAPCNRPCPYISMVCCSSILVCYDDFDLCFVENTIAAKHPMGGS